MSISKPRVTPVSSDYFRVSHRDVLGSIRQDDPYSWRAILWAQGSSVGTTLCSRCSDGADALAALVKRMNEIADCRAALIAVDSFEDNGGRARLETLGGAAALLAFDHAKQQLSKEDAAGLALVQGMVKIACKKRLPKAETAIVTVPWRKATEGVTIVPGFSIAITGGPVYFIGSVAEHGSYNLHYFGRILSITPKTVTVSRSQRANKRMKILDFVTSNKATVASKSAANAETSLYI